MSINQEVKFEHLCFAARVGGDLIVAPEPEVELEFVVDESGCMMAKRPVEVDDKKKTASPCGDIVMCCTGTNAIVQACGKLGARVPQSVSRRQAAEMGIEIENTEGGTTPRRSKTMKGKTTGMTIAEYWAHLFIDNEERKTKRTDEQLIAEMEKEFPQSAGKSTTNRPRMYRSCYNAGTYFYDGQGEASTRKGAKRPFSNQYADAKGTIVEPGTRGPREGGGKSKSKGKGKGKGKGRAAAETVIDVMSGLAARKYAKAEGLEISIGTDTHADEDAARAACAEVDGRALVVKSKGQFYVATLTAAGTGGLGAGPKTRNRKKTAKKKTAKKGTRKATRKAR